MTSDGSRDDHPLAGDSDRYRIDSASDSGLDSDGYHPPNEAEPTDEDDAEEFDEELRPLVERWKSMREGWWNKAGYESYWEVVKEQELASKAMGLSSIFVQTREAPKVEDLPDVAPPPIDLDALAMDATRPRASRERQVNVRLTSLGYDALLEAARAYGLRPTTLARLLIHRGAHAVLTQHRKDEQGSG